MQAGCLTYCLSAEILVRFSQPALSAVLISSPMTTPSFRSRITHLLFLGLPDLEGRQKGYLGKNISLFLKKEKCLFSLS